MPKKYQQKALGHLLAGTAPYHAAGCAAGSTSSGAAVRAAVRAADGRAADDLSHVVRRNHWLFGMSF